jgi:hypothetical protein
MVAMTISLSVFVFMRECPDDHTMAGGVSQLGRHLNQTRPLD